MSHPPLTDLINAIPLTVPFVGPETLQRARGGIFKARMGANENGFGPSPRVIAAMHAAIDGNWQYADPTSHDLIEAIAALHDIKPANIVVGEGIDGLLGHTVHMAIAAGAPVVTSDGAYPTFVFHVASHGGRLIKVPYLSDREDLAALLVAAALHQAAILYVSNPDNPMGSWWSAADIEQLAASLPPRCLLCLDEAYIDTLPVSEHPSIDVEHPQVLRFRTLSKAYGMAGARIGYALGPARLIAAFEKVRNHYGINRIGQLAAIAAIGDQSYLRDVVVRIARARVRISAIARDNGLVPLPSATGFVAIDCGDSDHAQRILDALIARDVFVRKPSVAPLSRCIRVSCAPDDAVDIFAQTLPLAIRASAK